VRDYGVRVVAGELDGAEHCRLAELEQQLRRPAAAAVESDECDCTASVGAGGMRGEWEILFTRGKGLYAFRFCT